MNEQKHSGQISQTRWVVLITVGVFAGLLLFSLATALLVAWRMHDQAVQREKSDRQFSERMEKRRQEIDEELKLGISWARIIEAVKSDRLGSVYDKVAPDRKGSFAERIAREAEYQERLKKVGLPQCQAEELNEIRSWLERISDERTREEKRGIYGLDAESETEKLWRVDLETRQDELEKALGVKQ